MNCKRCFRRSITSFPATDCGGHDGGVLFWLCFRYPFLGPQIFFFCTPLTPGLPPRSSNVSSKASSGPGPHRLPSKPPGFPKLPWLPQALPGIPRLAPAWQQPRGFPRVTQASPSLPRLLQALPSSPGSSRLPQPLPGFPHCGSRRGCLREARLRLAGGLREARGARGA